MYCPSCGSEINVELKYCRCGANLTTTALQTTTVVSQPVKLTGPSIVLGLTVVAGLGIIFGAQHDSRNWDYTMRRLPGLFCFVQQPYSALPRLIRFWTKLYRCSVKCSWPSHKLSLVRRQ